MKKVIIATTVALLTLSTANAEGMKCSAGKCVASMSSGKSNNESICDSDRNSYTIMIFTVSCVYQEIDLFLLLCM